ncbi:MAG: hypothetical protein ABIL58_00830 [Pseudomonadota bacterium]
MTVFRSNPEETGKTDETDVVGNNDFLLAVFGHETAGSLPVVVSFKGNPATVPSKAWAGRSWHGISVRAADLPSDANNYFSLSVFEPGEDGEYRRQKKHFRALHAVMLDDVGSKVPLERLTLEPSWLLETSPENYQAGYLLREPLVDGLAADRLMNAIVSAGLCDPGAGGPRTRLARLPRGANGKHSPPFVCRLMEWSPELHYSVEDLAKGLQLEMAPAGRRGKESTRVSPGQPADGDPVWIPPPNENAVLVNLKKCGLYKKPLGEGRHDITCPWVHEHTEQVDAGTAYFEPDDLWPIGGFKCHHGHCANRHISDLLSLLGVERSAARMKPVIRVVPGELHCVVDAAERELAKSRRHYQRGGLIVNVVTDPGTRETRVQEISQPALVRVLAGAATWERFDGRSRDWVRIDPPARHAGVLFDAPSYPHLPVLNGLARQPYLRPDGSLVAAAGYDPATGMFGVFDARDFDIPESPTRRQAQDALDLLKNLFTEFFFAGTSDLAAALMGILTASVRPSLAHAPMFHVRAHMVGSGKSYLCTLMTAFATPQRATPTTFPSDDEECRKMLLAGLLQAPAVIEFDNLTSDLLAHKSLCTVLSSEFMSGRILGVSKTATVGTRVLFLSSGNNVGPVKDMTRRCITIRLNPGCETPAARNFKRPDLVREVLQDRGRYVSAALTIVRAWISAGRPLTTCRALAGFADWSELCRQPLLWFGCPDPAVSVFEAMADDPDRETLGRLLRAWQATFGKGPGMVRDAVKLVEGNSQEHQVLGEVLRDIAEEHGQINRRKLGWWIKRHVGQIVDGMRFVRSSGNRSAEAWQVEVLESVSPVLPVSTPSKGKTVKASSQIKDDFGHDHDRQLSLFG